MQHTVLPGESLSAIARRLGVSLEAILALNPALRANPNLIRVGQVIEVPSAGSGASENTGASPAPSPAPVPRPPASGHVLGALSMQFESGGRGPATISTGHGDAGGVSYGSYQMTSAGGGTVARFVSQPDFRFRADFAGLTPGTEEFSGVWRDLATRMPDEFHEEEHRFIKQTHFDVLCDKIQRDDRVTVTTCSPAFQDVIWSTATQHGGNTDIVDLAFSAMRASGTFNPGAADFERDAITAIYAERGRKDGNGTLVHFSGNSQAVQNGVASRFVRECADALRMLP